ncbi:MAG: ammonium transporter [Candidatus Omnitrophica bacterium]|nr:ammonium transporter [Candidatus Omnitrophota bacterium]
MNSGDTAFVLISAALVMLMTPALAFFYGGIVRRKNILSVIMQCMIALCFISIQWVIFGYSLSFAPGNAILGSLKWFGLNGVGLEPYADYASTIPHQAFMIFQAMFAIITPALIIGAFAERIKFSGFIIFMLLWSTLVYDPVAHWVWGVGGWLRNLGVLDFAGGAVVHINAGIAALVTALLIGKRKGFDNKSAPPHNLPFVVLGAGLLWFGWFGFNSGSALAANGLAVNAFVVTNIAGAAAGLGWAMLEWLLNGKPTIFGIATGAIAGLAAITPAAGFVSTIPAIIIGLFASIFCYIAVAIIKPKLGYDDSLDAFGVHGISGVLGVVATGLFASKTINPLGSNGLFFGNPHQLFVQTLAALVTIAYSAAVTFIIYKIVDKTIGMRVSEKEEVVGLDLSQHREGAYTMVE